MAKKPQLPGSKRVVGWTPESPSGAEEAGDWIAYQVRNDLSLIGSMVRYTDFARYGDGKILGADEFLSLARLAMLDLFSAKTSDEGKAETLIGRRVSDWAERLAKARAHAQYEPICEAIRKNLDRLSGEKGVDHWAEQVEDMVSRETAAVALFSASAREKVAAAGEFLDRRSAKKGRESEMRQFHLPPELIELLGEASRMLREKNPRGEIVEGEVISAATLNVPQLTAGHDDDP